MSLWGDFFLFVSFVGQNDWIDFLNTCFVVLRVVLWVCDSSRETASLFAFGFLAKHLHTSWGLLFMSKDYILPAIKRLEFWTEIL